jgi:hypothetical protein
MVSNVRHLTSKCVDSQGYSMSCFVAVVLCAAVVVLYSWCNARPDAHWLDSARSNIAAVSTIPRQCTPNREGLVTGHAQLLVVTHVWLSVDKLQSRCQRCWNGGTSAAAVVVALIS